MAETPVTQESLIEDLNLDRTCLMNLLSKLNGTEQQAPFTDEGWSVKDLLAHMAHWKMATHTLLVAYTHDQPLPPVVPSGDEANAAQHQIYATLSLADALAFWEESHTHLQHLVADELTDERLSEEVRVPWDEHETDTLCALVEDMCAHDAEHTDTIEQYVKRIHPQ